MTGRGLDFYDTTNGKPCFHLYIMMRGFFLFGTQRYHMINVIDFEIVSPISKGRVAGGMVSFSGEQSYPFQD